MNGDRAILRCDRRCGWRPLSASSPPTGEREYGESAALIPSDKTPSLLNLNSFLLGLRCIDDGGVGR